MPVVLLGREWATIESGVIERAELLDLVLADLYGPRELLRRRLLPPEVVFAHPGFLRACDGIRLPGEHQLFNYASDLGALRRTAAASCSPTAPRRRRARATRWRTGWSCRGCCPSLYRDARRAPARAVLPRAARRRCRRLAPPRRRGPAHRRAHARARTARPRSSTPSSRPTLGYPLVEGADLTVRDGRVWMRSLGRLRAGRRDPAPRRRRVLRPARAAARVRSSACPGWSRRAACGNGVGRQHARQRRAREPRRCSPSCPGVAEQLLGQPLRLPVVPNVVVRRPGGARARARRTSTELVLQAHVAARRGRPSVFGCGARRAAELDELRAPHRGPARARWVGQEPRRPRRPRRRSTGGGLEPRRTVLRTFAVAARTTATPSMPGGLTRVAPTAAARPISQPGRRASARTPGCSRREPERPTGFWLHERPAVDGRRPGALDAVARRREPLLARPLRRAGRGRSCGCCGSSSTGATSSHGGTSEAGVAALRVLLRGVTARHRDVARLRRRRRPDAARGPGRRAALAHRRRRAPRHARPLDARAARRGRRRARPAVAATPGSWSANLDRDLLVAATYGAPQRGASAGHAEPARARRARRPRAWCATRVALHGRRPAHRAAPAGARAAARDGRPRRATPRPTACCSSRCSPRRRASSPTGAATGPRRSSRRCSTCCSSTRTTRGRSRTSSSGSPTTSMRCRQAPTPGCARTSATSSSVSTAAAACDPTTSSRRDGRPRPPPRARRVPRRARRAAAATTAEAVERVHFMPPAAAAAHRRET